MTHYLGVDLGSTTAKTVIVNDTGRIVGPRSSRWAR